MKTKTKKTRQRYDSSLSTSGQHLAGRIVLVTHVADPLRLFRCCSGFGCNPEAMGRAIFGTWLSDGSQDRIDRGEVERFATEKEIVDAEKYAKAPAKTRFETQMMSHFDRAADMASMACAPGASKALIASALHTNATHLQRIRLYLTTPTPDGSNIMAALSAAWADQWDQNNKRRF